MTTTLRNARHADESGFMMAAMLVAMAVMMIAMTAALPAWQTAARREKEAELIFRGKQYARAISAFSRKYGGAYPPTVDVLLNEHFLRKKYKDPITGEDFVFVTPGSQLPTTTTGPLGVGAATRPGGTAGTSTPGSGTSSLNSGSRISTTTSISTTLSSATGQRGAGGTASTSGGRGAAGAAPAGGTTTGIMGVYSKSKDKSLRVYNGYDHYNEWLFVGTAATQTVGSPTGGRAGGGTRGGAAGTRGGQPTGGRGAPVGGRGAGPGTGPQGRPGGFGGSTGFPPPGGR